MLQEQIFLNPQSKLNIAEFKKKYFEMPWHSHSEYELVYIIKGRGKKFVGDSMFEFSENDVSLIGPNVPHFFLADEYYYKENRSYCRWLVVQFPETIFPIGIENMGAFDSIKKMLDLSLMGINFQSQATRHHTLKIIKKMLNLNGLRRITELYHLLHWISADTSVDIMNTHKLKTNVGLKNDVINFVYQYLTNHFNEEIKLGDIAKLNNMQTTTLCSCFKRHTLKTIFEVLREIRISYACKLLVNTHLNIHQVAYESGYNNISNFNRQFLKQKKTSPLIYRNLYKNNV